MKLLVRIDRSGDVGSFRHATEGRRIDEIRLHNPWEAPWIRDALVQYDHPREATFFVVEAPSEASDRLHRRRRVCGFARLNGGGLGH